MKTVSILCAVLGLSMAKPNGYYHQEYNYQTSSSSYKNQELQHHNEDKGFYSREGDLEGRVRPRVNSHNEHSEYVNPKLKQGYALPHRSSSYGQLYAENHFRPGEPPFNAEIQPAGNYGYMGHMAANVNLRQVCMTLQEELAREMQRAVYEHYRRASAYSNVISQAQMEADMRALQEDLRRNMTMRLDEAIRSQFGTQGIRGGYYYTIQNGRLQPTANFHTQELEELKRQMEVELLRQLEQQFQTYYHTTVNTAVHTTRNTYRRVNGVNGNYPAPIQQRPPIYHPYPPQPVQPPVQAVQHIQIPVHIPDSITTVATRVQTELNEHLNRILEDTQRRYFAPNNFHNQAAFNYDTILAQLIEELRANITVQFDEQIQRTYGYGASKYSMEDVENLRRQIENNLVTKLTRDFNRQRERFFQSFAASTQVYHRQPIPATMPVPANQMYYPPPTAPNAAHYPGVGEFAAIQRQMQESLSRQLQDALMRHSYRQAHMYHDQANFNAQANYQATLNQLTEELNRNLTRQMEQFYHGQNYRMHEAQLASMRNALQQDLLRQLQQGLQQSYSRYSSWSSASSSSHSSNYRPVRGFDPNLYRNYGVSDPMVGEDCMMGDDPSAYQQQDENDAKSEEESTKQKDNELPEEDNDLNQKDTQQVEKNDDLDEMVGDDPSTYQQQTQDDDDLTQQTLDDQDLTQQLQTHDDLTQQLQTHDDLTQQVQTHDDLNQQLTQQVQTPQEFASLTQQSQDLTQQVQTPQEFAPLTQQSQDLTQQVQTPQELGSLSQRPQELFEQVPPPRRFAPLGQQLQYVNRQVPPPQRFAPLAQQPQQVQPPRRFAPLAQQPEDLNQQVTPPRRFIPLAQQSQDFTQQVSPPRRFAPLDQQPQDLNQQVTPPRRFAPLAQEPQDLSQQVTPPRRFAPLAQQPEDLNQQVTPPRRFAPLDQQPQDLTQQVQTPQDFAPLTQQVQSQDQLSGQQVQTPQNPHQHPIYYRPRPYRPFRPNYSYVGIPPLSSSFNHPAHRRWYHDDSPPLSNNGIVQQRVHYYERINRPYYQQIPQTQVLNQPISSSQYRQIPPPKPYQPQDQLLGQETDDSDLTQQTQDIEAPPSVSGQQTEDAPFGKLETLGQKTDDSDLTQQVQEPGFDSLTQQVQSPGFGQQTEDLAKLQQPQNQQKVENLGQQTEDFGKPQELQNQQVQSLGQQSENFGRLQEPQNQQVQSLGQQTEDLGQNHLGPEIGSPSIPRYVNREPITLPPQRSENQHQQNQPIDFYQQYQQKPTFLPQQIGNQYQQKPLTPPQEKPFENRYQENEELTQQLQDPDFGHLGQIQDLNQQNIDEPGLGQNHHLTQQLQDLELGQQIQDQHFQQFQDHGYRRWKPQVEDLTQQTEDDDFAKLTQQQTQVLTQQQPVEPESANKLAKDEPSQDLTQQLVEPQFNQQSEDLTQQTVEPIQQTQDLTQQQEEQSSDDQQRLTEAQRDSQQLIDLLRNNINRNQQRVEENSGRDQVPERDSQDVEWARNPTYQPSGRSLINQPNQINYANSEQEEVNTETVQEIEPVEPQVADQVQQIDSLKTAKPVSTAPEVPPEATSVSDEVEEVTTKRPGFWSRLGTSIKNKAAEYKQKIG